VVTAGDELDLLQGTLDVLVLKALTWGPRHGYAVARWIKDRSDAALQVEDRALYVALHRMEERGWIESEWGLSENNRRAKYYQLTGRGRHQLRAHADRWVRYAHAVSKVLGATT
jgi:transcriptional regulator